MCGISGIVGNSIDEQDLNNMVNSLHHRGPDSTNKYINDKRNVGLGHNRLKIIDLTTAGNQPMFNHNKSLVLVFNGEIYNYKELYKYFPDYPFISNSDSEIILAAYERWGEKCLDYFIGMFSFALWDEKNQVLFCARDRFGVKPFYYSRHEDNFYFASEIKAIHSAGLPKIFNERTWATYFTYSLYEHSSETFYEKIYSLPPGHSLTIRNDDFSIKQWYKMQSNIDTEYDSREEEEIKGEYLELLYDSIKMRFRSDVPLAVNLSGGLDSSILFKLIDNHLSDKNKGITAFTFATGDSNYDEVKWASLMLRNSSYNHEICYLKASEIPELALEIQHFQDEPFGGFPTLAYSKIFERARDKGIKVLLDGQGMDEQWAGYDYYRKYIDQKSNTTSQVVLGPVQGSNSGIKYKNYLNKDFVSAAVPLEINNYFDDALRNLQYRDSFYTKIPRALRFNDRISMKYSSELREPFLDHRLFELAFQQKPSYKIRSDVQKWMLRNILKDLGPNEVIQAPKRPVQTPQREWIKGELKNWVNDCISDTITAYGGNWFNKKFLLNEWNIYQKNNIDNSFHIWQLISLSLMNQINK